MEEWKLADTLMPFRRLEKKLGYDDFYSTLSFADRYSITLYAERDIRRTNPKDGKLYICCDAPRHDMNGEIEEPISKLHFDAFQISKLAEGKDAPPQLAWSPLGDEDNNLDCLPGEAVRTELRLTPKQFDELFWSNELEESRVGYVDRFSYEQYCNRNLIDSKLLKYILPTPSQVKREEKGGELKTAAKSEAPAPAAKVPARNKDYSARMPEIVQVVLAIKTKWENETTPQILKYGYTEPEVLAIAKGVAPGIGRNLGRAIKGAIPDGEIKIWRETTSRPNE